MSLRIAGSLILAGLTLSTIAATVLVSFELIDAGALWGAALTIVSGGAGAVTLALLACGVAFGEAGYRRW